MRDEPQPIGKLAGGIVNRIAADSGRVKQFPQREDQMNQLAQAPNPGDIMESVIVKGDVGKLSPEERSRYYLEVCKSVGLNPLTQPFSYITLNGKLTLYATRGCTDQLRSIHKVSVEDLTETERGDVFIVTAKVKNGEGRTDMAKGAVTIGTLKGDALANMIMKAETKAKRRATLSICGLGVLDESEIETTPPEPRGRRTREEIQAHAKHKRDETRDRIPTDLAQITSLRELERYKQEVLTPEFMQTLGTAQFAVEEMVASREEELKAEDPVDDSIEPDSTDAAAKSQFVRDCYDSISAATSKPELLTWWNSKDQKDARKRLLTDSERQSLMSRVFDRCEEIVKSIVAAG